jgi:hypothetical protein
MLRPACGAQADGDARLRISPACSLPGMAQSTNGPEATLLQQAERDFREAISRARAMGGKLYELRASLQPRAHSQSAQRNQAGARTAAAAAAAV